MVEQERSPALRRWRSAIRHILRDGRLSDVDTELEQFAMNARSAPQRIGEAHLPDQLPDFRGDLRPAARDRDFHRQKEPEAGAMPPNDGFWLYDREDVGNTWRDLKESRRGSVDRSC